jgi:methyltransferase family protein
MELGALVRRRSLYRSTVAVHGYRLLRRAAARVGLQVVARTFYSPIPELAELPAGAFERRSPLPGLAFDLDAQLRWLGNELGKPLAQVTPADAPSAATYSPLDATVLWCVMRRLRPRRVIELGSGASTVVIAGALAANARDGVPAELDVYDPFAGDGLPAAARLHRTRAQDVPPEAFERLGAGDVLFVDTTHTVKLGSDVNFVVLEVLPRLAPGVVVHFHDIFLPYEYPRAWLEDYGLYWTEQYLLQAFLSLNRDYEVLCAVAALARDRRAGLDALLPERARGGSGGAFWIRRSA